MRVRIEKSRPPRAKIQMKKSHGLKMII